MKLTLTKKRPEVGDVTTFEFTPAKPLRWRAGQYIQYTLPHTDADDRGIKRYFTISSAPYEGTINISTRFFDKSSSFKRHLQNMAIGAQIEAGEPEGDFVTSDVGKCYLFIAGGIGITPFHAILKQTHHDGHDLDAVLLYGNRDPATSLFVPEFEAMGNQKLVIKNVLEPERITAESIKIVEGYKDKLIYVSGPEPMVEAFEKILADLGIPETQQKRDYFPGYKWRAAS